MESSLPTYANLENLTTKLTEWNKEIFGNLFHKKTELWARIEGVQRILDTGGPIYPLKPNRKLYQELDKTLGQIETLWLQKSRMKQMWDGGQNTRYFHTSTIVRRRFNCIEALR